MEIIDVIAQIIYRGFGWSMLFSCVLIVYKNEKFQKYNRIFSDSAVTILRIAGIIWLLLMLFQIGSTFNKPYVEGNPHTANRMFGPYWFVYWIWFFSFCLAPLLLWIERLKKSNAVRLIFALLILLVGYLERLIILATSFNRDYLPSESENTYQAILFDALLKTVCFVLLVLPVSALRKEKKQKAFTILDEEE